MKIKSIPIYAFRYWSIERIELLRILELEIMMFWLEQFLREGLDIPDEVWLQY